MHASSRQPPLCSNGQQNSHKSKAEQTLCSILDKYKNLHSDLVKAFDFAQSERLTYLIRQINELQTQLNSILTDKPPSKRDACRLGALVKRTAKQSSLCNNKRLEQQLQGVLQLAGQSPNIGKLIPSFLKLLRQGVLVQFQSSQHYNRKSNIALKFKIQCKNLMAHSVVLKPRSRIPNRYRTEEKEHEEAHCRSVYLTAGLATVRDQHLSQRKQQHNFKQIRQIEEQLTGLCKYSLSKSFASPPTVNSFLLPKIGYRPRPTQPQKPRVVDKREFEVSRKVAQLLCDNSLISVQIEGYRKRAACYFGQKRNR